MSTHLTNRFATREPAGCAVCHRHAVWIGYHRGGRSPIVWLCDDSGCHAAAKRVYAMPILPDGGSPVWMRDRPYCTALRSTPASSVCTSVAANGPLSSICKAIAAHLLDQFVHIPGVHDRNKRGAPRGICGVCGNLMCQVAEKRHPPCPTLSGPPFQISLLRGPEAE